MDIPIPTHSTTGRVLSEREQRLRFRLRELCAQALNMTIKPHDETQHQFYSAQSQAEGWLTSALALVRVLQPMESSAHRAAIERFAGDGASGNFRQQIAKTWHVLGVLEHDIDNGLCQSISNEAIANTLGDFLDHAEEMTKVGQIDVASVLAGVAFEDAMRKAASIMNVDSKASIEDIIVTLTKSGFLSKLEASRARTAAGVRTSATHAKWDELSKGATDACIHFTRDLISMSLKRG